MLSDPQFVGTTLFMGIECQHLLTSDLHPQYCILGMYREKLQDQVIVNHLILLFKRYIYLKQGDKSYLIKSCISKPTSNVSKT